MNIRNVIFDLGGVMIDWKPRRLYEKIFRSDAAIDFFLDQITTSDWNEQQDAGRTIAEANAILSAKYPEYTPEIEAYYLHWEAEMLGGVLPGMEEILDKFLEDNRFNKVVALTNWSEETFPYAIEKFDFLQKFDGIVVSGHEKIKKPNPAIYHLLLKRFSIDGAESLFIDDSLRNVNAAREVGIHAIQFINSHQLIKELRSFGIDFSGEY